MYKYMVSLQYVFCGESEVHIFPHTSHTGRPFGNIWENIDPSPATKIKVHLKMLSAEIVLQHVTSFYI